MHMCFGESKGDMRNNRMNPNAIKYQLFGLFIMCFVSTTTFWKEHPKELKCNKIRVFKKNLRFDIQKIRPLVIGGVSHMKKESL